MKRFALKRIVAFVLAMIMTLSLCPVTALAELVPETYEETFSYVYEGDLGYTDEEAFAAYFQQELDASLGYESPGFYSTSVLDSDTPEGKIYDALKAAVKEIADGDAASAQISLSTEGWTAEELGVDTLISEGSIDADAKAVIQKKMHLIYTCLLSDCPMELYWHDKAQGQRYGLSSDGNTVTISYVKLYVATDYSVGSAAESVDVNTDKTGAAQTAITNAAAIVSANASKSDFEKLAAYKDTICELVSYDEAAAKNGDTLELGINPWQLIWVFDEDSDTNVVCEGYAKAFQYLCDLSSFSGDIECHTVSGYMVGGTGAGGHMWNVVTMDDGKNYLVDVTNCDEGTIGAPSELFIACTENSADENQEHTFTIEGVDIVFTYGEDMEGLFCDGYLALSTTAYEEQTGDDDEEQSGYTPLYWSDDGGETYNNGIETPFEQPLYNDGRMATLYVKSGDEYVAINSTTFGNDTITKLSDDLGYVGWGVNGDGEERLFWNTESAVEGTESGVVFTVDDVQYLINLTVYVSTAEEIAEKFASRFLYDYAEQGYYTEVTFDNAAMLSGGKVTYDAMTAERQEAICNTVSNADDLLTAGKFIYLVLDGHKYNGQHFIEITDSTSDRDIAEFVGGYEQLWGDMTATQKTMVNNALEEVGGQYTVDELYAAATEEVAPDEAAWFLAGSDYGASTGTLLEAVEYANGLEEGTAYIRLLSDVDTTAALVFNESTSAILDLNGKTIDRGLTDYPEDEDDIGNVITVVGELTLCDSSSTTVAQQGTVTGGYSGENGGGVYVDCGTFIMEGGTISGNTAYYGGGVGLSMGTFTMNGGAISGNTADVGGGVSVDYESMFTMNDGSISNNTAIADYACGGGVYICDSDFTMTGGNVSENDATYGGGVYFESGSFSVSGKPVINGNASNNVYVEDGCTIMVGSLGSDTSIGVTLGTISDPFTSGGAAYADSDYFFSDDEDYVVAADGSDLKLEDAPTAFTNSGDLRGFYGVFVFDQLNGTVLSTSNSVKNWGNSSGEYMYVSCGSVESATVYLATNKWDTLSAGVGETLTQVGTWTATLTDMDNNEFQQECNVYALTVEAPEVGQTVIRTITRSWVQYDESAQKEVTESESFTLTMDFSPVLTGELRSMTRGVAIFSKLENGVLGYDATVNNDNDSVEVMASGKTSQTVYLTAAADKKLMVSGDATLEQVGVWFFNNGNNTWPYRVYKMTVGKPANANTVSYTVTSAWDTNQPEYNEVFTLTFDFYPVFTHSGYDYGACGVTVFTNKSGTVLSSNEMDYSWWNENDVQYMSVACGNVASRTVYLSVDKWATFTMKQGQNDAFTPTKIGTRIVNGTNDQGETVEVSLDVYELTVEKPTTGNIVDYTVTRAWTYYDGNGTAQNRSESFILRFEFYPTFTYSGEGPYSINGVYTFTGLNNGVLSRDKLSVVQWFEANESAYAGVICGDVASGAVYLGVSKHEKLTVSGNATPEKVGTWTTTHTDGTDTWESVYNIYKLTVTAPASGNTVEYAVTRSWTWYDNVNDKEVTESYTVNLVFDFSPTFTGEDIVWENGMTIFTELDGTTLGYDMDILVAGHGQWAEIFSPGRTSQTLYLGAEYGDTFKLTDGTEEVELAPVGIWQRAFEDGGYAIQKVYKLEAEKPASGDIVEFNTERTGYYWKNGKELVSETLPVRLTVDFAPLASTDDDYRNWFNVKLFTDYNEANNELSCGENVFFVSDFAGYVLAPGAESKTIYLACDMYSTFSVTTEGSNGNVAVQMSGRWFDGITMHNIYQLTATKPQDGSTATYAVSYTMNNGQVGAVLPPLVFDFSPALTMPDEEPVWTKFGPAFTGLDGTVLSSDRTKDMAYKDPLDMEEKLYIACGDVEDYTLYLPYDIWGEYSITQNGEEVETVSAEGTLFMDNVFLKFHELTVEKPKSGNTVEYVVSCTYINWVDDEPQLETYSYTLIFDFSPAFVITANSEYFEDGFGFFTRLNNGVLSQDTAVPLYSGMGWADVLASGKDAQSVYLALPANNDLMLYDMEGNDVAFEQVGTWTAVPADFENDQATVYKIYELNGEKPADGNTVEYTLGRTYLVWDEQDPTNSGDGEYISEGTGLLLTYNFAPLLTGNMVNMEGGVALFADVNENGVLVSDNSVRGMRGSAMVLCGGNDEKTLYLAAPVEHDLTLIDSTLEKHQPDCVGVWVYDDIHFNVYALTVEKPADGGEVAYTVRRSWTYWENNEPVYRENAFPVTFDFTLNPDEIMPLTIDGIRVYDANTNGKLGYSVPDTYSELGANDIANLLIVPSRPNQDRTLYLASDEKLYDAEGNELKKCTNPAAVGNKTVYELTAAGKDDGATDIYVTVGDTDTTIRLSFIFHSVMLNGVSFYTDVDENGMLSYANRVTCDGLSVEYLNVPGVPSHFYMKVPFFVGEEKVLYIGPDNGAIASVKVEMGSIYDTDLYTFDETESDPLVSGYGKYYKLTLSDELSEYSNLMLFLYDASGAQIGGIDLQFEPHKKPVVETESANTATNAIIDAVKSADGDNEAIENAGFGVEFVGEYSNPEKVTEMLEKLESEELELELVPEQSQGCNEADKKGMMEEAAEEAENRGGTVASVQYFDITVALREKDAAGNLGEKVANVTDTKDNLITITITLSNELLRAIASGMELFVMRVHEGLTESLEKEHVSVDKENGTISFRTNKFSSYAVMAVKKPGVTVSGTVKSFKSAANAENDVTIQLFATGNATNTPDYEVYVTGNSAAYTIEGVVAGTYTMKVSKSKHVTREYEVTVVDSNVEQDATIYLWGDANSNGTVNNIDAMMVLQYSTGNRPASQLNLDVCNVNGTGNINNIDAMMILQYSTGNRTEFPAEQ